jgi:hypothetical protein
MRSTLCHPHASLCLVLLGGCVLLGSGCTSLQNRDLSLTAEEQVLMVRLTRDPGVIVESWDRNADGFLVVHTSQGNAKSRYIFMPDRPGEHALNIHHIDDRSRLVTAVPSHHGLSDDLDPGR